MIVGIPGDVGSGKTCIMTYFGRECHIQGIHVNANYELKFPYRKLSSVEHLRDTDITAQNLFCLDEAWVVADARTHGDKRNIEFSKFLLQARKKRGHVLYTLQDTGQVDRRIRLNTQMWIRPSIVIWEGKDGSFKESRECETDKPYVIRCDFYNKGMQFTHTRYYNVSGIPELYNTNEVIEEMPTMTFEHLYGKYKEFPGDKGELAAQLHYKEGLSKSEAKQFAVYIFSERALEYVGEVKAAKKGKFPLEAIMTK